VASRQHREARRMTGDSDIAHELRVIARLMVETKAPVIFEEQDAAKLRKAADELEDLRAAMDQSAKLAYSAVRAEPRNPRADRSPAHRCPSVRRRLLLANCCRRDQSARREMKLRQLAIIEDQSALNGQG
jgi:hypothetical protein